MKDGVPIEPARKIKYVKGYLERIHFAHRIGTNKYSLMFEVLPGFEVSSKESGIVSNANLCVHQVQGLGFSQIMETPREQDVLKITTTTTHNTHTNQLSESNPKIVQKLTPEEELILHASREGASP